MTSYNVTWSLRYNIKACSSKGYKTEVVEQVQRLGLTTFEQHVAADNSSLVGSDEMRSDEVQMRSVVVLKSLVARLISDEVLTKFDEALTRCDEFLMSSDETVTRSFEEPMRCDEALMRSDKVLMRSDDVLMTSD